jgi:DNA-binding GntR family transcriptional regulator
MSAHILPYVLYQEVAERLRQDIYRQYLKPREWIDEKALAGHYGISRTPLREALKVLHAEGLVTLVPRRGCYVKELSSQELDQIFPVMSLLEGRCAYEATVKASAADLQHLDQLHAELERYAAANDVDGYYEHNHRFHEEVQRLAGNQFLQRAISDLRKQLQLVRHLQLRAPGRLHASLSEHRQIMQALHARDAQAAENIMKQHLLQQRVALAHFETGEPGPDPTGR